MKIKVSDLKDEKLAEWTARAQGWRLLECYSPEGDVAVSWVSRASNTTLYFEYEYRPDINAWQAMDLAEKFGLVVNFEIGEVWKNGESFKLGDRVDYSAICRAVVASVYGEEIDDES